MKDQAKTKQVLIQELASLRQRIEKLEQSESDRKNMEEALRESEEKFRTIYDRASDGILIVDP
jgi:PAS domain-containing protein